MGSGKSKRTMLSTTVAPLAAILMMTAAVSAIAAGATDVGVACDERSFAADDATLRGGRAVGAGRIRVLRHGSDRTWTGAAARCVASWICLRGVCGPP